MSKQPDCFEQANAIIQLWKLTKPIIEARSKAKVNPIWDEKFGELEVAIKQGDVGTTTALVIKLAGELQMSLDMMKLKDTGGYTPENMKRKLQ